MLSDAISEHLFFKIFPQPPQLFFASSASGLTVLLSKLYRVNDATWFFGHQTALWAALYCSSRFATPAIIHWPNKQTFMY